MYGVKAIVAAINKRVTVTSEKVEQRRIFIESVFGQDDFSVDTDIKGKSPLKPIVFLAKNMIGKFGHTGGLKIKIESEIPVGVGLGSSSATCVAGAAAISGLFTRLSKEETLELAIEAEKTIFENTSGADCTVCTFGGIIEYQKGKRFSSIDARQGINLVIINSQEPHSTDFVVRQVGVFKEKNAKEFESMCKKESDLVEKVKESLSDGDIVALGEFMKENQEYLRQIGVSNSHLDKIVDDANSVTLGCKITGAGGGGCTISMVKEIDNHVIEKFSGKGYDYFLAKIDFDGLVTFKN